MDLCASLIKWLSTFSVDHPREAVGDLTDGVALAQILHQISPRFFVDSWLSSIKLDAATNWRIKLSNLKKILKAIVDYYAEEIGQQIQDSHMPDVTSIADNDDERELGRLLQLILGCAVNCENKQEYIQRIMSLEQSVQIAVMKAIQELSELLDSSSTEKNSPSSDQLTKAENRIAQLSEQRDVFAQRCHDLDQQVIILVEERASLQVENERLVEKLNQAESLDNPDTPAGRRFQQLQRQNEQLQAELEKSETAKDDLRIRTELMEKEFYEIQQKNEELNALALESRHLRDEVDILRNTADKVTKYEAMIASYKKKLEDLRDVKGQLKLLEEKNAVYVQKNLDLEDEVKKSAVFKTQLDGYKKQLQEAQMKSSEEVKRASKAEFEAKRFQEKLATLQREKERLQEERDSLNSMNEELNCSLLQKKLDQTDSGVAQCGIELMNLPLDVREQFIRLQHENKMLKMHSSSSESDQLLQSLLDDANTRKNDLECEVRAANQRILELEAQVEDLDEMQQKMSSNEEGANSELKKRLTNQMERCSLLESDLQAVRNQLEEQDNRLQTKAQEVDDLQAGLTKKENEMKEVEEKYKRYLAKAKSVIKQLDPKNNNNSSVSTLELQSLKLQLQEKDKYIQLLEKESARDKQQRDNEESLMISAWYNLGQRINRNAAEDRLCQQSFLSRQRQAHTRRTSSMTNTSPSTPNQSNVR